jgi:hypothetical protein
LVVISVWIVASSFLSALELCAYGAACDGDLAERLLSGFPDIDRAKLNVLRVETAKAIRDGHFNLLEYFDPPGVQGTPVKADTTPT